MRNKKFALSLFVITCLASLHAANPEKDGKNLDEQLKKISLVASDNDGRRVVNRAMAKELGVDRKQLVEERRSTQLMYGQIFLVHEIAKQTNSSFAETAKVMTTGKIPQVISAEKNVDLKKIVKDARKFNSRLEVELGAVAAGNVPERSLDLEARYDPQEDSQPADTATFTTAELLQAQEYVRKPPSLKSTDVELDRQSASIKGGPNAGMNGSTAIGGSPSSHGMSGPPAGLPH